MPTILIHRSDIVGRKTLMIPGIAVFLVGSGKETENGLCHSPCISADSLSFHRRTISALCGAAKSMTWLIGARAMQGFGGGAIISLTQIIIGDIIPLHRRGVSLRGSE
jgi:MFS family permease